MTDSPVAAANARTMCQREIPPIVAISSRVNSLARWLSINQSAFWAGFMDDGLHSKRAHHDRFAPASFDRSCSHWRLPETGTGRKRPGENNSSSDPPERRVLGANYFPPSFA